MPDYRRYRVPGGTYFFTVNLLDRRLDTLVRHIEVLREAVRASRRDRPFHIDDSNHMDYIHWNPVIHGLVKKVSDWPFSSFHRYVQAGILPIDWVGGVEDESNDFGERHSK